MSITDHDTIDAYFELQPKDIPKGLLYIPGTELSVNSDVDELYNLSLNFDEFCKINKINMENYTSENVVGRPMIAQYMIKQKICDSVQQCFQSYLSDESPAFQKLPRQSMEDTITKLN